MVSLLDVIDVAAVASLSLSLSAGRQGGLRALLLLPLREALG